MAFEYYTGERLEGYELACDLIIHGASAKQVSSILGVSDKCVYNWRRRLDIGPREQVVSYAEPDEMERKLEKLKEYSGVFTSGKYVKNKEGVTERFKEMVAAGKHSKEISEELGISRTTVSRWRQINGVVPEAEKLPQHGHFYEEWCKEWDDFISRLKRPLRLEKVKE